MLWRAVLCGWFLAVPGLALAQSIALDSGEHGAFTRLTLPLAGPDWSLAREGTGYDLSMPAAAGFDLSRAFDKITRDRIAALSAVDPARLRIELACDCMATAFVWRGSYLVIDISEDAGPPAPPALPPAALPPVVRAPDALPGWFPSDVALPLPFGARPAPDPAPAPAPAPYPAPAPSPAPAPTEPASPATEPPVEAALLPSDLATAIAQDLARAATQGLLSLAEPGPPASAAADPVDEPAPQDPGPAPEPRPGIRVESSVDRAFPPEAPIADHLADPPVCGDQSVFDLPQHDEGLSPSTAMAYARSALYPDPQMIDPDAALLLVQTLVSYGFGAEARQAIDLAPLPDDAALALGAMARIVDGEAPDAGLAAQAGCSDAALFWAYLAGLAEPPEPLAPLIATYRGLPTGLREPLGYRLAARLASDGAQGEADAIYQLASGGVPRDPALASMAAAQLDHQAGAPAAARRELEAALAAGARSTPELLLDLFAAADAEGKPVSDAQIVLVEEALFTLRGTPASLPLEAALIRAQIGRNELLAAQKALSERKAAFDPSQFHDLTQRLGAAALTSQDDVFLRIAFDDDLLPSSGDLRQALSDRLGALGFTTRANAVSLAPAQEAAPPVPEPAAPGGAVAAAPALAGDDPVALARNTLERAAAAVDLAGAFLSGGN